MKSERINRHQIRFTLNRADLSARQLKMSDLTYGSDKTKTLFDDMLRQAVTEFGFDVQNQPVMIEAIPVSEDKLMITMTQVSDHEDDLMLYRSNVPGVTFETEESSEDLPVEEAEETENASEVSLVYAFRSFEDVLAAAHTTTRTLRLRNALYRDPETGSYYLQVSFIRLNRKLRYTLMSIMEYAADSVRDPLKAFYVQEHYDPVIQTRALQKLCEL